MAGHGVINTTISINVMHTSHIAFYLFRKLITNFIVRFVVHFTHKILIDNEHFHERFDRFPRYF